MRMVTKLIHTSVAEGKDPRVALHEYLLTTRATPHPATGKSPAEMLFNRTIRTTLPGLVPKPCDDDIRHRDAAFKRKTADLADSRHGAKTRDLTIGDRVLKQRRETERRKHEPPYDPDPYTVTKTKGTKTWIERRGYTYTRDRSRLRKVVNRPDRLKPRTQTLAKHPPIRHIPVETKRDNTRGVLVAYASPPAIAEEGTMEALALSESDGDTSDADEAGTRAGDRASGSPDGSLDLSTGRYATIGEQRGPRAGPSNLGDDIRLPDPPDSHTDRDLEIRCGHHKPLKKRYMT